MSKMSLIKQSLVFQVGPPYSCTDSLSLSSVVQTECHQFFGMHWDSTVAALFSTLATLFRA